MNPVITEGSTAIQVMDIITIAFTIAPHIIRVTTTADIIVTIAIITIVRMMIKHAGIWKWGEGRGQPDYNVAI
jgi:hypothetical protein